MNRSVLISLKFAHIFLFLLAPSVIFSQSLDIPRSSPKASVSQFIGVTKISIDYCRPSARDREVFGGIIPFGKVWRAGANEATTVSFSHSIKIDGQDLPAGKYGLFAIPDEESWTIIFNSEWNQWGAYHYNPEHDVLRIKAKSEKSDFTEMFTVSFSSISKEKGTLSLSWEKTRVDIPIETDTYTNTVKEIDDVTEELKANWYVYSAAAQYYFYELKNTTKSIELIDVAIALDAPNPAPWMLKSQILASLEKYEAAIEQAELALKVCEVHNFSYEIQENEEQIKRWEKLLNNK